MKFSLLLVIGLIIFSCSSKRISSEIDSVNGPDTTLSTQATPTDSVTLIENDDFDYEKAMQIESYLVSDSDPRQTTAISSKCAVYVFPDGETLKAMQKKYGQDYYTIADDANWYMSESSQTLDSIGIKEEGINTRYVRCLVNGISYTVDLRAPTGLYWNLFFFHSNKKPKLVDIVGLSPDSVRAYFDLPEKP